jgi:hypothetical protein
LLKASANDAEVKGSMNMIFIPMNGLLSDMWTGGPDTRTGYRGNAALF